MNHSFTYCSLAGLIVAALSQNAISAVTTYHHDHRQQAKLMLSPSNTKADNERAVTQLAYKIMQQSGVQASLTLYKTQQSLTATHYRFQQQVNGVDVEKAELVISVDSQGRVIRTYNNLAPFSTVDNLKSIRIDANKALQTSWDFLQVTGRLTAMPKHKLVYRPVGKHLKLSYKVNLSATAPQGDWEFFIDASKPSILNVQRIDLPLYKNANPKHKWTVFAKRSDARSLDTALAEFSATSKSTLNKQNHRNKASGTALVFDPDPRTTLNDQTLEDNSAATAFDPAYQTVTLLDITERNGTFSLEGPWVVISDWDPPTSAPSTTSDGNWTAKRGDNAFDDVMVYYHIDQNQRYIQSLGFVGATGIQYGAIEVDTNGANGDDQSYFQPGSNRLSFGHGCVNDSEDIDVILHEYGHAINYSINPNFDGGDTGAIGEGFGDYWAASYSWSTPNGRSFHPEWAFSWDGHNNCWPGRLLNQTSFRYDPSQTYGAHEQVNGQLSDELWSTPLAQAHLNLLDAGVPRGEIDQIVLESQFGLASGITMPDMANAIVDTALRLFPTGPHATEFYNQFRLMNILGEPIEAGTINQISAGSDNVIDPGDSVVLNIPLTNNGLDDASSLTATLSSSLSGITVSSASGDYGTLARGEQKSASSNYQFEVDAAVACGTTIPLNLTTSYQQNGAQSSSHDFTLQVGQPIETEQASSPALSIPDNNSNGITDQLTLSGASNTQSIAVSVDISHTYRGDLTISLTSPAGTTVVLKNADGNDGAADVRGTFGEDLQPAESLSAFAGEDANGVWTLSVADSAAQDVGTLNSWSVIAKTAPACNGGTVFANQPPTAQVAQSNMSVAEGTSVTLDASASSDPDGDNLSFMWTQTGGPNVTLSNANTATASFTAPQVNANTLLTFEVTVDDGNGGSSSAQVSVTVTDTTPPPTNNGDGGSGGGGGVLYWLLALLGLSVSRRR